MIEFFSFKKVEVASFRDVVYGATYICYEDILMVI